MSIHVSKRSGTDQKAPKEKAYSPAGGISTRTIVETAMFTAVIAALSQLSIPMPSGVPVTMQTFAVALTGVVLAWKLAVGSTAVYILLGAAGVPVFAQFSGGIQVLVNYTGGFIWGFLVMAFLCGLGTLLKNKALGILLGIGGLIGCHLLGVLQFMLVMDMGLKESFLLSSAPYLVKDVSCVILAFAVGGQIRKRLLKAGLV